MEHPPDPFDRLPDEVFQIIFGAIQDCKTLVRCMAVSRAFRAQSVRVPSLSIVCPGFFSSYDAKLKGVYMMVKEFRSLESLVVRVGQPKEEPPTWARCMRYAEIGTSVEKFVFMAAKSGDFSEFDVEVAEAEVTLQSERSSSFDRQREQSWEMWREELLSRGRAQLGTREDEPNEMLDTSDSALGDSAGILHFEMDANKSDPYTPCAASSAEATQVLESEASRLGTCTSLQLDSQANVMGKQHPISTDQEGSKQGQRITSHFSDQERDRKLKGPQDNASSSNSATNAMSSSSEYLEEKVREGSTHGASSSKTGECTEHSSNHQGQPRPQAEGVDDPDSIMASPFEVQSSDLMMRKLKNFDAYQRVLSGHGRHSYEGWDFVRERCRLPDFVLRQVIAPSNDVLKRMVPVIVFAIVQGLDEFRDSVPTFIGKFAGLRRFILVDMVESVTVYMREHHIKQIRDQGVSDREGLREGSSSGTQAEGERAKAKDSEGCKKIDNRNLDVRDVENLPDFPLNLEGTPERDKGKAGRRRVSGKALKEGRMKGIDLNHRISSDYGNKNLSMSEDDRKDYDIRRWKGKGIVSSDEIPSQVGSQAQEVRYGSEASIVENQEQVETGVLKCLSSSDVHAPQSKVCSSRFVSDSPEVDYSSDVSDISVCVSCGWANDRHPCESRDCPRHVQRTICKQQVTPDTDNSSKFESGGTAGATCLDPSQSYISLKNVTSSTGVAYGPLSVDANQHSRAPVTNDSENSRDEESGEASSSSNFVDKSDSDAPPGHGVADGARDGGIATETGSESEKKEKPWFQYLVGLKNGSEGSEVGHMGSGEETSLFSDREGQGGISRQSLKNCSMSETRRSMKASRNVRKGREDSRGFSLRRSHRMMAERSAHRMRHSSLPAGLMVDHADTSGGPSVDGLAPEILISGTGEVEGSALRVAETLGSESSDCDVAVRKSIKGKQLMDEEGEESGCSLDLLGSSSTAQASSSLMRSSYGQEGTSTPSFGLQAFQFQEQGGQTADGDAVVSVETCNNETLGGPQHGRGEVPQSRSDSSRLGWIQLREATRGDRPRVGHPPFERLSRDRSHDRDIWRDRVRRRARDHRRDGEGDRDRRERMRDGARKRQRDIETEALYFDISFWRTEQVVARNYSLSDVSMCVATHFARPLTTEELDILSRAALAGPLLAATIGYVNKQVSSHNL